MPTPHPPHAVDSLRSRCQASSTRKFNARGIALQRCQGCLLGLQTCICRWRTPVSSRVEFVLIMHRDEVFKPTNTGRLIADTLPSQCHAYLWSRTEPDAELLQLLADPARQCVLVFPPRPEQPRPLASPADLHDDSRTLTFLLLDGTWKQASKMAAKASWLRGIPALDLDAVVADQQPVSGNYQLRQASADHHLSTAEAAALCLRAANQSHASETLLDYFNVFNEHYVSTRMNRRPNTLPAHHRLLGTANEPAA
ncbi:DTW domain-containing protein [Pseudomaricurvus alcaniphilus]|uniref:tRNA-uridine aminocarboxypropyltransferase n=1 Tax=Pseudomaricurvus alcaniphilus TaxID=1166482 RepID=UPI00140D7244|nr:DTW domain-containing protein [Pseudomaricurvus alcaniphilus]NHN36229.1 DTW domain-containing protein [Pseudomaricurvus alcaniphilus]